MANPFDQFDPPAAPPEPRKPARAPAQGGNPFYDGVRAAVSPLGGRITSTNGGRHNVGSEHYSGRAVDVGMGRETPEQQASIKARLEASGYRVRDERTRPAGQAVWSGPHLHVSMLDGGSGGGGGGGAMGPSEGNPFDQFDEPAADPVATFRQLNAARQQATPDAPAPAPDFSNVSVATTFSGGVTPDYAPAFNDVEDPSSLGKIGLRALVGRIPTLAANLVELPGNVAGAIGDALPDGGLQGKLMREGFGAAGDWLRNSLGYENDMQAAGYGAPSVSGGDVLDALNPMSGVPLGERASRVGKFIQETLVGSGPDMLAAVGSLPAYMAARTNEVSTNRAANDGRANPSLTDLAVGAPAAAAESLLERFTTGRLLPGGGAHAPAASLAEALTRVAKETGLQSASGAVEEVIPYLAETAGTQTGANLRDALSQAAGGALAEGALGAAVDGSRAVMTPRAPAAPASLADLVTPPPTLPAVAAEGVTAPRQGVAPSAPPTPAVAEAKPEVAPPTRAAEAPTLPAEKINTVPPETRARPDMAAATRSIDDRLAALDETAAGQIPETQVSALNTERQELDDLLREQDRAKREGLIQSPESRLSADERATADARRTEIAATLERHRAARTAADQAQRLRTRLENTDSDAGLFEVAREINPTLGTPQAESFRSSPAQPNPTTPAAPATKEVMQNGSDGDGQQSPVASPVVSNLATGARRSTVVPADTGTTPNSDNVGEPAAQSAPIVGQRARSEQPSAPPTSAPETGIPVSPRAESQREPAPPAAPEAPARTTSLKNAVTDAERVAEGRDPIIRAARKGNRETVDEAVRAIRETPSIGRETAARLAEGGPVELKDEAVLLVHKVDLRKRRDAAAERAQSPNVSEKARAIARREYDDAVQQIDEVDQATSRIGTESGRLLQLRKRMIAEDYSMPALERKLRMVVNRDLKPAEQAEIKELAEKVATLHRKLDAVESQQASAQVAEMLARLMKQAPGKNATLAERRAAAMESKAALSAMSSTRAPQRSIPEQTDSAAFRRWFGDSKVVDANGDPLVVYHGAAESFDTFRPGPNKRPGHGKQMPGMYFSPLESTARAYARTAVNARDASASGDGVVIPAFLSIRSPAEFTGMDEFANANRAKLEAAGHDGAFRRNNAGEIVEIVAFRPEQIKSATANRGTFDPGDSNIMRSQAAPAGKLGQARAALADRLGRGVVARLERAGVLVLDDRSGGTWDGTRIGIGNVASENALGVLLHEVTHANMLDVLGEQGYERALRDLDALEAAGDPLALKAKRRAAKSGETGQRLDDERIAYMVEEATNAATPAPKVTEFVRSLFSAFRRWAATSAVFRALEKIGVSRPTLKPADFAAFARKGLDRMVADAGNPESAGLRGKVRDLETQLRTDTMTGMKNRRAFDEDAALGWPTVAAIDMDGLGKLNDAVGHEAADKVLKALADTFMDAENDSIRVYRHTGGDELAVRFKNAADADRVMDDLQRQLDGMNIEMDVAGADGVTRSFTYEGIGITYGTGATYEQADAVAGRRKTEREQAGLRQSKQDPGPSRRVRENSPRPGGRREGDPPAVGAQRSIPADPVFKVSPPKRLYRGIAKGLQEDGAEGLGSFMLGKGLYSSPSKKFAAQYGDTIEISPEEAFPRDPLVLNARPGASAPEVFRDWLFRERGFKSLRDFNAKYKDPGEYVRSLGYDGVFIGDEVVRYFDEPVSDSYKSAPIDPTDPNIMRSIPEGEDAAPAGADPVAFFHLSRMGAFHYADGARTEAEWTKRMEGDLGPAADRYRSMLPDAFKASNAQADRVAKGPETVAEAVEAIGDQRRPRDVKRVVRAVVAEGMRGEDAIISATAQALDMDDADVRTLFVLSESQARTLTEAQAELKSLRQQLRDAQKPDPDTRYQDTRARDFQRRIADLEARIAAGDFAKQEKTEHELVERNKRLQFELEKTKERFHKYALEAEFQNRTPIGKIFGETVAGINFARAIMTSLDLSAILRQGGKISFGHPLRALKAVPGSLKAFVSEDADFRIKREIESRQNAPLYQKFGLELTSIGGVALNRAEENYASRWVEKLPTAAGGGLIRGSGRSYTAFLNRLRADSFDAMLAALARDGSNPTKEEGKAIANYINVATGRGKVGMNEKSGEVLNTVFFAPRLVASRFQLLAGQPLYGGSNRTRKMIAMEYARFLIGVSVAIGLAMLMRDEDDETKPIELDPRSANFGKVRFGDTFLDPLAGLAQVTVFLARVLSGETRTTTKDELKPLRDSYRLTDVAPGLSDGRTLSKVGYGGRDVPDVITSFLRSKLAPVPGAIINLATGKNMIGEEVTPLSAAGELVTPMSVGNLVDVLESQGMARGTAINLLGILGMSVQYRKSDEEKAVEEENGVAGAFGFGTADRSTDEQP